MGKMKAIKRVSNAVLYEDGSIRVSNVRFSYPHLDKPYKKQGDKGEAKFGVVGMLPKNTHKEAYDLIQKRIDEVLKENKVKALSPDKKFLKDGDESDKDEYEGHWTLSARESRRPALRDEENNVVEPEDAAEVFYGGCWGSLLIRPWFQNNEYGKRVNAGLSAARKKRDDEEFGEGRISDEEVDEAFEDDDDENERPRSRRRSRDEDEDEDERPRSRRRSRDEDEDEEEEERPRRRRRARDEDDDDDL